MFLSIYLSVSQASVLADEALAEGTRLVVEHSRVVRHHHLQAVLVAALVVGSVKQPVLGVQRPPRYPPPRPVTALARAPDPEVTRAWRKGARGAGL